MGALGPPILTRPVVCALSHIADPILPHMPSRFGRVRGPFEQNFVDSDFCVNVLN